MTPHDHEQQRRRVEESSRMSDSRAERHNAYPRRTPRQAALEQNWTIPSACQSIRELGEMLVVAERYPTYAERMAELERLAGRLGMRLATLRGLIDTEYMNAIGVPPAGQEGS